MMFVFVCDLFEDSGLGHLRRCEAIAQLLKKFDEDSFFVLLKDSSSSDREVPDEFEFKSLQCTTDKLQEATEPWKEETQYMIVDSYQLKIESLKELSNEFRLALVCDEIPSFLPETLDLLIYPHSVIAEQKERLEKLALQAFVGPQFFPLRQSITNMKPSQKESLKRIHLQLGGSSTRQEYTDILKVLVPQLEEEELYVVLPENDQNFEKLIEEFPSKKPIHSLRYSELPLAEWSNADLLVGPASITAYEYAFLGTPSLYNVLDGNQDSVSLTIEQLGMGSKFDKSSLSQARTKLSAWSSHCLEYFSASKLEDLAIALRQA